ncbi:hypothetical protein Angca_001406 [Angiostrongylus cantonensis]|nr:hypothetical protein Angca_001406 [Angiostrongylus cantonensis]
MEELGKEKKWKESFFKKYFCEVADDADLIDVVLVRYRKYVAVLIPLVLMQTLWWLTAIRYSWLSLYATHWHLPAIMIVGSTIAGMTSEGGGAVAFPVMTLGLGIAPTVARDFSLIVQSIEDFVVVHISGIFTAFAGSGVDICIFSIITLLFRVSEKTATPTTIVLMGMNSVIGVYYRSVWEGEISPLALDYVKVTVPVAVTLAPIGSFLGSHFHRKVLASFIYVLEGLAVAGFLAAKPPLSLVLTGACILAIGFMFFLLISKVGSRIMMNIENAKNTDESKEMLAA